MQYDSTKFLEWDKSASCEEKVLYERILELSEYFEDMLFEEECESGFFIPEEIIGFSYTYSTYRIKKLPEKIAGYYNVQEQELAIDIQYATNDNVILHEMIHLHEAYIAKLPIYYHERLLWKLYQKLKLRISNIDDVISKFMDLVNLQDMQLKGGAHSLLFCLKSFDLDIKVKNPLGTVMGYDGETMFSGYRYK